VSAIAIARRRPHLALGSLCLGLTAANLARPSFGAFLCVGAFAAAIAAAGVARAAILLLGLFMLGWWWGGARLDVLDRSPLSSQIGRAERSMLAVTGPARRGQFELRVPVEARRFGRLSLAEPSVLELPLGRAPPQGALLEAIVEVNPPRGPKDGFDEATWLRRHGVHVVLHADRWKMIGRRGGLGGVADRLHAYLGGSIGEGVHGERRGVLMGVVLGEEQGLSQELRDRFRSSGLYHLLAVSGQNVALVAGGAILLAWLLAVPRWLGELAALAAIAGYVLAVGAQPSVIRAGIAGALCSLAWLTARGRDRWYFLLLGALALLAWNPYLVLDPGFELSFTAVAAIFVFVAPLQRVLEGYPIPAPVATIIAVATACGVATAPILWFQFHTLPLLSVPANVLAAPAVVPLLTLAFAAAAAHPLAPGASAALAWLNGFCAAYLAWCARTVGGLPLAQVRSGWVVGLIALLGGWAAAYAWRRGRPQTRLPPDRHGPAEDRARAPSSA
jgi:competence protein ComEC